MNATTADRAAHNGAKALTAAVITYIVAAAMSLGAKALNIPAPVEAVTTLLIVAALAASVGVIAIWASIVIGAVQARSRRA